MANFPIKDPKEFEDQLRQIETTDPVHISTINPLLEQLINNDAFLKQMAEQYEANAKQYTDEQVASARYVDQEISGFPTEDEGHPYNPNNDFLWGFRIPSDPYFLTFVVDNAEGEGITITLDGLLDSHNLVITYSDQSDENFVVTREVQFALKDARFIVYLDDVEVVNRPYASIGLGITYYVSSGDPEEGMFYINQRAITDIVEGVRQEVRELATDLPIKVDWETVFINDDGQLTTVNPNADDTSGAPGPQTLVGGTMAAGYFGTILASQFITGTDLAMSLGISQGVAQFSNVDWLKFAFEGKILFRPMKPIRHSISWDTLNAAECVFGGRTITIGGQTYRVRLMRGALTDPSKYTDPDRGAIGSEWNQLMLPIHVRAADQSWNYPQYAGPNVPNWGIGFTDEDLHTHNSYGDGTYVWCQETREDQPADRVVRGYAGVSNSLSATSSFANAARGWAPVLELI